MTIRYFTSSVLVSTPGTDAVTANDRDTIIVEAGVTLGATGGVFIGPTVDFTYGIFGADDVGDVDVIVFGTVFGTTGGILLNDSLGALQTVFVGGTGRVLSEGNALILTGPVTDVENAGLIRSDFATMILQGSDHDVLNTGTITSVAGTAVLVSTGNIDLVNTGTIRGNGLSFLDSGNGQSDVWNTGLMVGSVLLGSGDDTYQGGGQVVGVIDGGGGNDTVIGGAGNDAITDFFGANWLAGGDGADSVEILMDSSAFPVSHLFGGVIGGADTSAADLLDVEGFATGANIFLSTGAATGLVTRIGDNAVLAYINGFENATGTDTGDAIIGSAAANVINGAAGGDWMVGNGGADRFVFSGQFDAVAGDQIRDFRRSEADRIDLTGIDANTATTTTNDAFVFRTTRTSNAAAEAVITNFGNSARVDLYTNADNIVDGTFIVVYGEAGVTNLQATDFIL